MACNNSLWHLLEATDSETAQGGRALSSVLRLLQSSMTLWGFSLINARLGLLAS